MHTSEGTLVPAGRKRSDLQHRQGYLYIINESIPGLEPTQWLSGGPPMDIAAVDEDGSSNSSSAMVRNA